MKKKVFFTVIALCLVAVIGTIGCKASKKDEKSKGSLTFGNITFDHAGQWNQLSVKAFQYAADKVGVKVIVIPVINNTEDQVNGMQTLISAGVDAISCYTATAELDVRLSQMAKEAKIPISFENGVPAIGAEYVSIATHDWKVLGQRTAQMHCDLFKGRKALLVLGAPGMSIVEPWLEGYNEIYEKNGKPFEVVDIKYTDWGTELALNVTQDFIQSGRSFDAIFAHNGPMYAGVMSALKDAGLMNKVVKACGGGQDDELEWIKAGELDGTISYLPAAQGIAAFKGLWLHLNGKVPPKAYDLPMVPITKDNVNTAVAWDNFEGALRLVGGLE
jgi:ABC-type sugar transport system substrate-binding protein